MNYTVRITQAGRGGLIFYTEDNRELPFSWEFAIDGALIFLPAPTDWDNFCAGNSLSLTATRRDEILQRVCTETIRQQAPSAKYTISDDYISISFGRI